MEEIKEAHDAIERLRNRSEGAIADRCALVQMELKALQDLVRRGGKSPTLQDAVDRSKDFIKEGEGKGE